MNAIDVGKYLAELRKYYKITQDELAGRLGVTRQAVSKWETGITIPDIEILMSLSEIYGISINDILKADLTKIKFQKEIVFPDEEKNAKKIFVIGCGRWGTFIAWYLDKIGHMVSLYGRAESGNMKELLEKRKNAYLCLSDRVSLTTTYDSVQEADYVVISVGAQNLQNLAFGKSIVQGKMYSQLAEGYYTVKAIRKLGKAYGVELPICDAVYQILYEEKNPKTILKRLFERSLKNEFT